MVSDPVSTLVEEVAGVSSGAGARSVPPRRCARTHSTMAVGGFLRPVGNCRTRARGRLNLACPGRSALHVRPDGGVQWVATLDRSPVYGPSSSVRPRDQRGEISHEDSHATDANVLRSRSAVYGRQIERVGWCWLASALLARHRDNCGDSRSDRNTLRRTRTGCDLSRRVRSHPRRRLTH